MRSSSERANRYAWQDAPRAALGLIGAEQQAETVPRDRCFLGSQVVEDGAHIAAGNAYSLFIPLHKRWTE